MSLFSRQPALNAHSWAGVFLGVFLYLLCLSGTLVVFNQEFERWEQPDIQEFDTVSPDAANAALNHFVAAEPGETEHYFLVFPTSGIPRFVVENDTEAYFADEQGNLLEKERFPWSKMLVQLHYYLHLPHSWGLIAVSTLGAVICMLVISGFFAHKRLVKDAFRLRRGGSGQTGRIDLHNRFGIWASPFHLMIGITGTYFGLAGIVLTLVAQIDTQGDRQAVTDRVFTPEPHLEQPVVRPDVGEAMRQFAAMQTGEVPIFLTVHDVGTPQQLIELYAQVPGKMIYSENYRFDVNGQFIGTAGYKDGQWGKQLLYSVYRLHFGDFAGLPVKLLYFILGIMLTVLCVSGMDIWLAKQGNPPRLSRVWGAMVWGTLAALALSAACSFVTDTSMVVSFWLLLGISIVAALFIAPLTARRWQFISAISCVVLILTHMAVWQGSAFTVNAIGINSLLAGFALWAGWRALKQP